MTHTTTAPVLTPGTITTGLTLDIATTESMLTTIRTALIRAVGDLADYRQRETVTEPFRIVSGELFNRHPDDFRSDTFYLLQLAFEQSTTKPSGTSDARRFREQFLDIDPDDGTFVGAAFLLCVDYLIGYPVTGVL